MKISLLRIGGMAANVIILAACCLVCGCGDSGSKDESKANGKSAASSAASPGVSPDATPIVIAWKDHFRGADKCEVEFITRYLIDDFLSMVEFARTGKPPADPRAFTMLARHDNCMAGYPVYEVTMFRDGKTYNATLDLKARSVWDPEVYVSLLASQVKDAGLQASKAADAGKQSKLLSELPEARLPDLIPLNTRVTAALQADFLSPENHCEAALLLLTLAVNESGGAFYDSRFLISRGVAHLAFAQALSPEYASDTLRVADALRKALDGNQVQALEAVRTPAFNNGALVAWRNIVELRCTHDYRGAEKVLPATFLEKSQALDARVGCTSVLGAVEALRMDPSTEPRWMAILAAHSRDVASGHYVTEYAWNMHLKEASDCYLAYFGEAAAKRVQMSEMLNHYPAGFFEKGEATFGQVIGWGQWAQFFQRQLCGDLDLTYRFYGTRLGDQESAAGVRQQIRTKAIGDLWFGPILRQRSAGNESDYHAAVSEFFELTETRPELVSRGTWCFLSFAPDIIGGKPYIPPGRLHPYTNEWFMDSPLPGTASEMDNVRFFPVFTATGDTKQHSADVLARAPYDRWAIETFLQLNYKDAKAPSPRVRDLLKNVGSYDVNAVVAAAAFLEDADAAKYLKPLAGMSPEILISLNTHFRSQLTDEEFAANAEKLLEASDFSVKVSYQAAEMVNYYMDHDRRVDAKRWADFGGDVYSEAGLYAQACYYERIGDYDEAVRILQASASRYNHNSSLIDSLVRFRQKYNYRKADDLLSRLAAGVFPGGMKSVRVGDFSGPPSGGIVIMNTSAETEKIGIDLNTVIVACNNIAVVTFDQYQIARDSNAPEPFVLIVCQNGQYREVTANPPDRRFGVDMAPLKK